MEHVAKLALPVMLGFVCLQNNHIFDGHVSLEKHKKTGYLVTEGLSSKITETKIIPRYKDYTQR
jgi:hypothetical protein